MVDLLNVGTRWICCVDNQRLDNVTELGNNLSIPHVHYNMINMSKYSHILRNI
jgi:hypothetical protein